MEIITKEEFEQRFDEFSNRILDGAVFIYPTDTVYGIGCDATNPEPIEKIRKLKSRIQSPFSVIAPSKGWIEKNCGHTVEINKLPGPYTLIMPLKEKDCVSDAVHPGGNTLGVRIPNHWFSAIVEDIGIPIITTSVNKKDEPFMTSIEDGDKEILSHVDFIIDEGKISGRPSTLIDLTHPEKKVTER